MPVNHTKEYLKSVHTGAAVKRGTKNVNLPDIQENEHIENGKTSKGEDVNEDHVHPCDIDTFVVFILSKGRHFNLDFTISGGIPGDFEKSWYIVQNRKY